MFEGHDTTAAAMSFMVHSLGADADRCKKVQAELDENLANIDDDEASFDERVDNFDIDHKDLEKIDYGKCTKVKYKTSENSKFLFKFLRHLLFFIWTRVLERLYAYFHLCLL